MASQTSISLRVITQRLSSTPTWQLPHIVPYIASTIGKCGKLFLATDSQDQHRDGGDAAVLVHKFKTQISTLLQDKSFEGRWAAIVLVKATIEIGGWEMLKGSTSWVRSLLGILGVRFLSILFSSHQRQVSRLC